MNKELDTLNQTSIKTTAEQDEVLKAIKNNQQANYLFQIMKGGNKHETV